jgi:hypothetical protein
MQKKLFFAVQKSFLKRIKEVYAFLILLVIFFIKTVKRQTSKKLLKKLNIKKDLVLKNAFFGKGPKKCNF